MIRYTIAYVLLCILVIACASSYIPKLQIGMDESEVKSIVGDYGVLRRSCIAGEGHVIDMYICEFFDATYGLAFLDKKLVIIDKISGSGGSFSKRALLSPDSQVGGQYLSTINFENLDGMAIIVADDGQYLGKISSNTIDSDSIMNSVGRYGSEVSSTSIFNEVGRYGGKISSMSPFNDITSRPPRIFVGEGFIAYLTTNSLKTPRVDPYALIGYLKSKR